MDIILTSEITEQNAITFQKEMTWLSDQIDRRLEFFFQNVKSKKNQ